MVVEWSDVNVEKVYDIFGFVGELIAYWFKTGYDSW
jgi:hypothetical protein